jgi:hypothetical protein
MRLDWSSGRAFCRTDSGLEIVNAKEMEPWSAASLAKRIKIVLVLENWGWGGAVLQYGLLRIATRSRGVEGACEAVVGRKTRCAEDIVC